MAPSDVESKRKRFGSFLLILSIFFSPTAFSATDTWSTQSQQQDASMPSKSAPAGVSQSQSNQGAASAAYSSVMNANVLTPAVTGNSSPQTAATQSAAKASAAKLLAVVSPKAINNDPLKKPYGKPILKSSRVENVTDHSAKLIFEFEWRYWIGDSNGAYEPRIVYSNSNGGQETVLNNQYATSIAFRQVPNPEPGGLSHIGLYTWRVEATVNDLMANANYGGNGTTGLTAMMYIYPKGRTDGMQNVYQQNSPGFLTLRDAATLGNLANFTSAVIQDRVHPQTGVDVKASIQMASVTDAQQNMALRIKSSDSTQVTGPIYFLPARFSGNTASFSLSRNKPTQATTYTYEVYDLRTGQIIKTATATYTPSSGTGTGTGTGGSGTGTGGGGAGTGTGGQTGVTTVRFNTVKPITTSVATISGTFQAGSPVGKIMLFYLDPKTGKSVTIGTQTYASTPRRYNGTFSVSWNTISPTKLSNGKYKVIARVFGLTGAPLGNSIPFQVEIKK